MGRRSSPFKPKGQPRTIQCIELQGPSVVDHVEQLAETLKRTPGIRRKNVFVRHDSDGFSRLYYGTYYCRLDSKTGKRSIPKALREDLMLIKELAAGPRKRYFLHAMIVPFPTADVGNPEWALQNVNAVYTLQVAVFVPTDEFYEHKQAAAEYCAFLREKGYEAYYFHGTASSMVTVGAFGEDALITIEDKVERPGERGRGKVIRTYYSDEVEALQRNELLKYNLVNGGKVRERVGNRLGSPVASQLVQIPKRAEDGW